MIPRSLSSGSRLLLDVVDRHNRPVCCMPQSAVLKQHLVHRAVALFVCSSDQALLVRGSRGWDLFARGVVPAGTAMLDTAERLARQHGLGRLPLREIRILPPAPAAEHPAFTCLYAVRISSARLRALAVDPDRQLLLDADELSGIARHNGALLSPLLRHTLQVGCLLPQVSCPAADAEDPPAPEPDDPHHG